jgi:galactonate dehydratase
LYSGLAGIAGLNLPRFWASPGFAFESQNATRSLRVEKIDRTTVCVPFREIPERAMSREIPHWKYSEIVEVHLQGGQVGFGETLLYYTWGATSNEDVARGIGQNAASLMWDDSLGAGLQMALFDAVAKANDVPIHRLLGHQLHEKTPLSWWNIDTSADDMADRMPR